MVIIVAEVQILISIVDGIPPTILIYILKLAYISLLLPLSPSEQLLC